MKKNKKTNEIFRLESSRVNTGYYWKKNCLSRLRSPKFSRLNSNGQVVNFGQKKTCTGQTARKISLRSCYFRIASNRLIRLVTQSPSGRIECNRVYRNSIFWEILLSFRLDTIQSTEILIFIFSGNPPFVILVKQKFPG